MRNEGDVNLKKRVLNAVFFVGIFMSFSCGINDLVLGLGILSVVMTFACGVITVGLYAAFRKGVNYERISLIVAIFLSFAFFPAMWFITGGSYRSIPYFIIINAGIIALLLSGWKRKLIVGLYLICIGIIMVIEYRMPGMAADYDSRLTRSIDLSFGLFMCLFSVVVLTAVLIDGYSDELNKSNQYFAMLEERNREIEAKNRMLEKSNEELKKAKEEADKLNKLLNEEKQNLQILSITDDITGTYNRRYIVSYLNNELAASRQKGEKLTVALIDIDNFKTINDKYGHLYGDYVIEKISKTILGNLRQNDIVGRFGGDEFLIILPCTDKEEGHAIMERVRKKILEIKWDKDMVVTISGGVREVKNDELENLLNELDRMLYSAKNKSKNLIECNEIC